MFVKIEIVAIHVVKPTIRAASDGKHQVEHKSVFLRIYLRTAAVFVDEHTYALYSVAVKSAVRFGSPRQSARKRNLARK